MRRRKFEQNMKRAKVNRGIIEIKYWNTDERGSSWQTTGSAHLSYLCRNVTQSTKFTLPKSLLKYTWSLWKTSSSFSCPKGYVPYWEQLVFLKHFAWKRACVDQKMGISIRQGNLFKPLNNHQFLVKFSPWFEGGTVKIIQPVLETHMIRFLISQTSGQESCRHG